MSTLTSADGTTIAYERTGDGPALILIDGAMCYRGAGPMSPLAEHLRHAFTVYTYDRRGRGESGDTLPYSTGREIEDLRALVAVAGGSAAVGAMSSGGALALATAAVEPGIAQIALYEPPFTGASPRNKEYTSDLADLLEAGRRGHAVARFMSHVGVPSSIVDGMRSQPSWARFEAIAPTLAYDDTLLAGGEVPRHLTVDAPLVVIAGGASPEFLRQAAMATADAFPGARYAELDGQTHDVDPAALAAALVQLLATGRR